MVCWPSYHLPVWSFHLDSPLGPLLCSHRADSTLHPSRLDQSEQSIPQPLAQKEHMTQAGRMRCNPKTSARTVGKEKLCLSRCQAGILFPESGWATLYLPIERKHKAYTDKSSTERWREMVLITSLEPLDTAVHKARSLQTSQTLEPIDPFLSLSFPFCFIFICLFTVLTSFFFSKLSSNLNWMGLAKIPCSAALQLCALT